MQDKNTACLNTTQPVPYSGALLFASQVMPFNIYPPLLLEVSVFSLMWSRLRFICPVSTLIMRSEQITVKAKLSIYCATVQGADSPPA